MRCKGPKDVSMESATRTLSKPRRALFWAILVAIILAVPLFLGEVAARMMLDPPVDRFRSPETWAHYDEVIGWAAKPGVFASTEPGNATITYWPNGRRATRNDSEAKVDRPLLAVVGDSWSMGYGVKDEETFAWRLDAMNPGLAVANFGAGGYSTYQAYLMVERAFATSGSRLKYVLFVLTSYMVSRDVSYYAHARSVRTLTSSKVYLPPLAVLGPDGKVIVTPPFVTEKWPLEENLALINVFPQCRLCGLSELARGQPEGRRPDDRQCPAHGAVTGERPWCSPDGSGARELPAGARRSDGPSTRRASVGSTAASRDNAEPEMRVGNDSRYHPNGRLHARFAECIQSRISGIAPL